MSPVDFLRWRKWRGQPIRSNHGVSCMPRQIIETGPRIAVEGRGFLGEFEVVAAVGAGHVVGQHGAERLVFVIDLGAADDVTLTGKKCRHPPNWAGDLVDLRVQQNAWIAARRRGPEQVQAHWPGRRRDVGEFLLDDHLARAPVSGTRSYPAVVIPANAQRWPGNSVYNSIKQPRPARPLG